MRLQSRTVVTASPLSYRSPRARYPMSQRETLVSGADGEAIRPLQEAIVAIRTNQGQTRFWETDHIYLYENEMCIKRLEMLAMII
jgi:hypothetical protein